MFDNIFVGSSAVFPNRPGPVEHKTKGDYDKKMEKKASASTSETSQIKRETKKETRRRRNCIIAKHPSPAREDTLD